jgi:hypothetical protein
MKQAGARTSALHGRFEVLPGDPLFMPEHTRIERPGSTACGSMRMKPARRRD